MKQVLYTAADLMFPCSQKMLFVVHAEQFPVQAAVGQWMSQTALVQLLQYGVDGTRSYSSPRAPGQMHSNCSLQAVLCSKLPPSLTALCDGKSLDLAHLCSSAASWS